MLGIFARSFVTVFMAELGDKTQFAALSLAASSPHAKWAIFAGSALALALTSLVAVLAGDGLMRAVGSARAVKAASGLLFIAFGVAMLVEAARG